MTKIYRTGDSRIFEAVEYWCIHRV